MRKRCEGSLELYIRYAAMIRGAARREESDHGEGGERTTHIGGRETRRAGRGGGGAGSGGQYAAVSTST